MVQYIQQQRFDALTLLLCVTKNESAQGALADLRRTLVGTSEQELTRSSCLHDFYTCRTLANVLSNDTIH